MRVSWHDGACSTTWSAPCSSSPYQAYRTFTKEPSSGISRSLSPDNRRPVDYNLAEAALGTSASLHELLKTWADGRVKQRIVRTLLKERAESPQLFAGGEYRPIALDGEDRDAYLAFKRVLGGEALLVLVTRFTLNECPTGDCTEMATLPCLAKNGRWRELLRGLELTIVGHCIQVQDVLNALPVAVLRQASA